MSRFDWHKDCSYNAAHKARFHSTARARLRKLAELLGLPTNARDIRSNAGGIAVSGEITLHGEHVYIQVSQWAMGTGGVLIRTCNGRRDFCGGRNNHLSLSVLDDLPYLAAYVRKIAEGGTNGQS
jgi:hypothetical protein